MKKSLFICFFSVCISVVYSQEESVENSLFVVHEGLHFSDQAEELTLDLYLPKKRTKKVPCIIVIQGGGFRSQDGKKFIPFAEYIAEQGFAAALISYRGIPDFGIRTTMSDIKESVRFVRKISEKYDIDGEKIGAMGRSAGATLTMLLAVGDDSENGDFDANQNYSSNIQGAVGFAGVYDFVSRFSDSIQRSMQTRVNERMESNGKWIGVPFSASDAKWYKASVINNISEKNPPILLFQCKDDTSVPWMQASIMHKKLEEKGLDSDVVYYETGGHGFHSEESASHKKEMVQFFKRVFQ